MTNILELYVTWQLKPPIFSFEGGAMCSIVRVSRTLLANQLLSLFKLHHSHSTHLDHVKILNRDNNWFARGVREAVYIRFNHSPPSWIWSRREPRPGAIFTRLVFCHGPPFSNPPSRASIRCNIHEVCLLSGPTICDFCMQKLDQAQYSWEDGRFVIKANSSTSLHPQQTGEGLSCHQNIWDYIIKEHVTWLTDQFHMLSNIY